VSDADPELLYGRNSVREALRGPRRVLELVGEERALVGLEGGLAGEADRVRAAARPQLDELCGSPDHQGLAARVEPYRYADPAALLEPADALVVVLDQVQDPQNLGAVCRSAEGAGARGVVIPTRRAAPVTPAAARASAGAVEHLAVARVVNVAAFLREAKEAGAWAYGAEAAGDTDYTSVDWTGRCVLVLGAEGRGLRRLVRETCDALVSIPLRGQVESLNVGAAGTAILFEAARQRRKSSK
jgi:23S rRNA (guanosine2251-2'-O)-methyltransferase